MNDVRIESNRPFTLAVEGDHSEVALRLEDEVEGGGLTLYLPETVLYAWLAGGCDVTGAYHRAQGFESWGLTAYRDAERAEVVLLLLNQWRDHVRVGVPLGVAAGWAARVRRARAALLAEIAGVA